MKKSLASAVSLCLVMLFASCSGGIPGITKVSFPSLSATSFSSGDAFSVLPPGDMLLTVDVGTLLNSTAPALLALQPDKKQEFDKQLADMQAKTSIDPKQLKLVALSMTFPKTSGGKPEFVGVMTGTFDTAKLGDTLKKDPKTSAERPTETYEGQTIYIQKDAGGSETGVTVLDGTTVAMGMPVSMLKKSIDTYMKKGENATKDADLMSAFKSTKESALVRFAMKFPKELAQAEMGSTPNPNVQPFMATKYMFGSLDASSGFALDLVARTASAAEAKPLYDKLNEGLNMAKQYLGMMNSKGEMKGFPALLSAISLTTADADVKINLNVTQEMAKQIAEDAQKMQSGAMAPPMTEEPSDGMDSGGSSSDTDSSASEDGDSQ
jgi:hypothetical protein